MKKLFLLLVSFSFFCFSPLVYGSMPSSSLEESQFFRSKEPFSKNTIDLLTGEYQEEALDGFLPGQLNFGFTRIFKNQEEVSKTHKGWAFNLPNLVKDKGEFLETLPFHEKNLSFEYDNKNRLKTAVITNNQTNPLATIRVSYQGKGEEIATLSLPGTSLPSIDYIFNLKKSPTPLLEKVLIGGEEIASYEYIAHPKEEGRFLIHSKKDKNGSILLNEYYDSKHPFAGRIKSQKIKGSEKESFLPLKTFKYGTLYTEVMDGNGNKTKYVFNENKKITHIEHYEKESSLLKINRFFWDAQGNLLTEAVLSPQLEVLKGKSYLYDEKGLLQEERLYGNLSGKSPLPLLSKEGTLKGESYATSYTYDDQNRVVFQKEDNSLSISYTYEKESFSPSSTFMSFEGNIVFRSFTTFDSDFFPIETLVDDGKSSEKDSLEGITERRITRREFGKEGISYGLLEKITESFIDTRDFEEKILKSVLFTYDSLGRVIEEKVEIDNTSFYLKNITYDTSGNPLLIEDSLGNKKEISISKNKRNIETHIQKTKEASPSLFTQKLDGHGRVIKETQNIHSDFILEYTHTYDAVGNKIHSIDSLNQVTEYTYNPFGEVLSITYPLVEIEEGILVRPQEFFEYDVLGNVTLKINALGQKTETSYTSYGKPLKITYPDGSYESFTYFLDGSLKEVISREKLTTTYERDFLKRTLKSSLFSPTNKLVKEEKYTYNPFRKLSHEVKELDLPLNKVSFFFYGYPKPLEILKEEKNRSFKEKYQYDPLFLLESIEKEQGGVSLFKTSLKRDSLGIAEGVSFEKENASAEIALQKEASSEETMVLTSIETLDNGLKYLTKKAVNKEGEIGFFYFNAKNELIKKEIHSSSGLQFVQRIYYNALHQKTKEIITSLHNGEWKTYTREWEYNASQKIILEKEKGSGKERIKEFSYTPFGALKTIKKADGVEITHEYNQDQKLIKLFSSDETIHYTYLYDEKERLIQVLNLVSGKKTERIYDSSDNLIEEILENGLSIKFIYNELNQLVEKILPDGTAISYVYENSFLKKIEKINTQKEISYTYEILERDALGNITQEKLPFDLGIRKTGRDASFKVTSTETPFFKEYLSSNFYTEKFGERKRIYAGEEHVTLFNFHTNGSLLSANETAYTYDSLLNMTSKGSTFFTVNELNELIEAEGAFYTYDKNGNLLEIESPNKEKQVFSYDALDRLIAYNQGNTKETYSYDSFQRMVSSKKEDQEATLYLYAHHEEIGSFNEQKECLDLKIEVSLSSLETKAVVLLEKNGHLFIPLTDCFQNIVGHVNTSNQEITWSFTDAYGKGEEDFLDTALFSSKRYFQAPQLYYFGKRFYCPSTARFITPDPFPYHDSFNRYTYALNDPVRNKDLFGLYSPSVSIFDFFEELRDKLSYEKYLEKESVTLAEQYFHKTFLCMLGFYIHDLEAGTFGEHEINDKIRITAINGILNIQSMCQTTVAQLSSTHGNINVHYIFRPTYGWAWDIMQCILTKSGFVSPQARLLATRWKELIQEMGGVNQGGEIFHYAHSIGGTDTFVASQLLTEEEKKMIKVFSFGSATLIPKESFQSVINFVNKRDGVTMIADPIRYFQALFTSGTNVHFTGSLIGIPLPIDHGINSPSYVEVMEKLGKDFMEKYINNPE